jgi:pimeloyl-ACP methyl ester carboxylesterase
MPLRLCPRRRSRRTALLAAGTITLSLTALPSTAAPADEVRLSPEFTTAAGTTFAWASLGDGPPLLLLNGTASPMSEWDPALLGALADGHRVLVFDYPGLGMSGAAPARWSFSRAADWVADLLVTIAPGQPVDVVGWSMGGFIAQRLAVQHPALVDRLVLAATNPGGDAAVLGPRWVQEADNGDDETAYLRTNYPRAGQRAGDRFLNRLSDAVGSGRYPDESVPAATRRAMVRAEDPWLRSNVNLGELQGLDIPTLIITGARDVITPPVNSRRLAAAVPGAELHLVPRAGHSFLFQQPIRTARLLDAFLSDVG